MRTSLGETTNRTRSFSDALPVSPHWRAAVRLAGGAATLVVPLVAAATVLIAVRWMFGLSPDAATAPAAAAVPMVAEVADQANALPLRSEAEVGCLIFGIFLWSAVCLYLYLSLLGTTLAAENQLGYSGAAVTMLFFLSIPLARLFSIQEHPAIVAAIGMIAPHTTIMMYARSSPDSHLIDFYPRSMLVPLAGSLVLQAVLAALFIRWYGRRMGSPVRGTTAVPQARRWWRPRLTTKAAALSWLTLRQAVPMAVPGLMLACLMGPTGVSWSEEAPEGVSWWRYADSLACVMSAIGMLWGVIVGSGIFSTELDWRAAEFWRSRPIAVGQLFALKFLVGMAAVLLVLDGTAVAVGWKSTHFGSSQAMNWAYLACIVPLHATMFALAVAVTCLLRRSVIGGMATMALLLTSEAACQGMRFHPTRVYDGLTKNPGRLDYLPSIDYLSIDYLVVALGMASIIAASALVGWGALRRYDPHRSTG
jgi:hypothetical protein